MNLFSKLYDKTLYWASHEHAPYYLAGVSFAESSFFPVPPDVMLVSMGLAKPHNAWRYAWIATLCSVLGGVFGYVIGWFFIDLMGTWLHASGYDASYQQVVKWFQQYGVWIVFLAGFSPIPYKLFTIAAGALNMAFIPFVAASCVGRGLRFFLVSSILYIWGEKMKSHLRQYIDVIGWASVVLLLAGFFLYSRYLRA